MGEFEVYRRQKRPGPGRPPSPPEQDADRLRVHAAYCRRIGRHSLADALDRGADLIEGQERWYAEHPEAPRDGRGSES